MGMVALTGAPQAWFLTPFEINQAMGDSMKRSADDPVLAAELSRLARADAAHINNLRQVLLVGRKDLSRGDFPDVAKQRFYEVTIFRVRPGHEDLFEQVAKAYGASAGRSAPNIVLPCVRGGWRHAGSSVLRLSAPYPRTPNSTRTSATVRRR